MPEYNILVDHLLLPRKDPRVMKIVRHPYQANVIPQPVFEGSLWQCVVCREGSAEILVRHEAANKEDACCLALLEISRLKRSLENAKAPLRNAS